MAVIDNKVTRANTEAGTPATARAFLTNIDLSDVSHTAFTTLVTSVMVPGDKVLTMSLLKNAGKAGPDGVSHALLARQLATYGDFADAYHIRSQSMVLNEDRPLGAALRAAAKTYQVDGLVVGVPMPGKKAVSGAALQHLTGPSGTIGFAADSNPGHHAATAGLSGKERSLIDVAIACVQKATCNVVLIVKYQELDSSNATFDMNPDGPRVRALRARLQQLREAPASPAAAASSSSSSSSSSPSKLGKKSGSGKKKRRTSFAPMVHEVVFDEDDPAQMASAASASTISLATSAAPSTSDAGSTSESSAPSTPPKRPTIVLPSEQGGASSPSPSPLESLNLLDASGPLTPAANLEWESDNGEAEFIVSSSSSYSGSYYSTASNFTLGSSLSLSSSSQGSVDSAFLDFLEDVGINGHLPKRGSSSSYSISSDNGADVDDRLASSSAHA